MTHDSIQAKICTTLALLTLVAAPATAATADPAEVDLDITRVALFKNGLGFYNAQSEIDVDATTVSFAQLPVPVFGTFWVSYGRGLKVRQFVSRTEKVTEQVGVQNIHQLLAANVGHEVKLYVGADEIIEGTLLDFAPADDPATPQLRDSRQYMHPAPFTGFITLETHNGTVFLDASMVRRAVFPEGDLANTVPVTSERPSLNLELEKPAHGEKVHVSYLSKGATWTPAYLIDLTKKGTARFSASALVVNEVADFDDVQLELVTGFPHISFADVTSPLARANNLAQFVSAMDQVRPRREADGMLGQSVAFEGRSASPAPDYSAAREGQVAEDLFLYPVDGFSLKKGETAWTPLFSTEMPYEHIYTWKIADFVDPNGYYRQVQGETGTSKGEIWHSCRLTNTLDQPLTTAATEFVSDGQFVGQDICHYTAPGSETTIRINRAMNVLAEQSETEVRRERQAIRLSGQHFDLVEIHGELELTNKIDHEIALEVVKELSGDVLEVTPGAEDVKTAEGLKKANPRHHLTWEFSMKPGEMVTLTYRYKVYIRS